MMLSLPSALAAATSASIPPQSVSDVAVAALHQPEALDVPPHAATITNATTARPSRRVRLLHFMFLPLYRTAAPGSRPICRGNIALDPAGLQGRISGALLARR